MKLMNLKIKNFKGITAFEMNSEGSNIEVYGNNGTGKTSLFDAFTWLLFDKDSKGKTRFSVQPLDSEGNIRHYLNTEVSAVVENNKEIIKLTRTNEEKWERKKGTKESTRKGTENKYFINDELVKQTEYKAKIDNMIDETVFKMITNPSFFSEIMTWQDRRKVLEDIVHSDASGDVTEGNNEFDLIKEIIQEKRIDSEKRAITTKKKRINDELKLLPCRIDELKLSKTIIDEESLTEEKQILEKRIEDYGKKLSVFKADFYKVKEYEEEISKKREEITGLKNENIKNFYVKTNDCDRMLNQKNKELQIADYQIETLNDKLDSMEEEIASLQNKYKDKETETPTIDLPEGKMNCPVCGAKYPEEKISALKEEYKNKKIKEHQNELDSLEATIKQKKAIHAKTIAELSAIKKDELEKEIEALKKELSDIYAKKDSNPIDNEIKTLETEIEELTKKAEEIKSNKEKMKVEVELATCKNKLSEINIKLTAVENNKKIELRIKEIEKQVEQLTAQYAELEHLEYLLDLYKTLEYKKIEESVNNMFKYVKFKMFDTLINGSVVEVCEPTVDGIPFTTNLNTGARLNAGLDIINTLCNYYKVTAPIFIDNRESVTSIIKTDSQTISLIVSKDDNKMSYKKIN